MLDRLIKILTSLRLTVVLLVLAILLVFIGTLAQVNEGLYNAQARYFKSWLVIGVTLFGKSLPLILPGGYLVGTVLLVNLLCAHIKRFKVEMRKPGILLTHGGLVLLLLGQLLTDMLSTESAMRLEEGERKNYSEDFHANELVLINKSATDEDEVISIPESMLAAKGDIREVQVPFTLRVKDYWPNSFITNGATAGAVQSSADQGIGPRVWVASLPVVTEMDRRNIPTAVIEVNSGKDSLGSWLVSSQSGARQTFEHSGKTWEIALRFKRFYKPYTIQLLNFTHERYPGTELPKDFRSRIRLTNPETKEDREVEIFMNNPLRYDGLTFYQASFEPGDTVTIFQVVRNPGWLTPYFGCAIVGLGLVIQFLSHLLKFARKRIAAGKPV